MHRLLVFASLAVALLAWAEPARAQAPAPGSLLLFPEYDTVGVQLLTVTNTNPAPSGAISTRWMYVSSADCVSEQFEVELQPNDTYTVNVASLFPSSRRGFVYVLATSATNGTAISFNWLAGASWRFDPLSSDAYEIAPIPFRSIQAEGTSTDLNGDGRPALDGNEYEGAPDEVLLPRFLGQGEGSIVQSEIVLLSLAGTANAPTRLDFLAFNDNEEVFSLQHQFQCWEKRSLQSLSSLFLEAFLDTTNNDPDEIFGLPAQESGWMRIDGRLATAPFPDTAVMAFLVDRIDDRPAAAAAEWRGVQFDGVLPGGEGLPPVCTTDVSIALWPPNHQVVEIDLEQVAGVTDPASLPTTITITSITQDEPVNGQGDGNTICDGSGVGTAIARLRAERSGNGNGRVYVVNYTATNSLNLACDGRITVQVPHSQNGTPAADDGQSFDSTEGCP
jgi:hypothetical protein